MLSDSIRINLTVNYVADTLFNAFINIIIKITTFLSVIIELTKTLEKKIDNNELQEIKEIVSKIINLVNKRNALL